jgi:prepilin-type N-terminal cleavage/methylation domain-containing protein
MAIDNMEKKPQLLNTISRYGKGSLAGFTLIEIVFVVFLIGIIAAISYPHLDSAIDQSRYIECEGQLESLRRAKSLYVVDHLGQGSPGSTETIEVFESYFVHPFVMGCPRLGTNSSGNPEAPYVDPYNVYAISTCPYCATNIPTGGRAFTAQP